MSDIAIYSYFGYPLPFSERVRLIGQAGFEVTSIGLGNEEDIVRSGDKDLMPELVRAQGLSLEYVHAPEGACNDLWSESEPRRQEARDIYASSIAYCRKHLVPILVIHVSRSKGEQPLPVGRSGLAVIEDLVRYAEDSGVILAIENTQQPVYLDHIFSAIQSPFLGFCYDSSHDFLYSPEPGFIVRQWGHLLVTTHISDNDGLADRHWIPGEGIIPWGELGNSFPSDTYHGFLNLEIFPRDPAKEVPWSFLQRAREGIRWCQGMLRQG